MAQTQTQTFAVIPALGFVPVAISSNNNASVVNLGSACSLPQSKPVTQTFVIQKTKPRPKRTSSVVVTNGNGCGCAKVTPLQTTRTINIPKTPTVSSMVTVVQRTSPCAVKVTPVVSQGPSIITTPIPIPSPQRSPRYCIPAMPTAPINSSVQACSRAQVSPRISPQVSPRACPQTTVVQMTPRSVVPIIPVTTTVSPVAIPSPRLSPRYSIPATPTVSVFAPVTVSSQCSRQTTPRAQQTPRISPQNSPRTQTVVVTNGSRQASPRSGFRIPSPGQAFASLFPFRI